MGTKKQNEDYYRSKVAPENDRQRNVEWRELVRDKLATGCACCREKDVRVLRFFTSSGEVVLPMDITGRRKMPQLLESLRVLCANCWSKRSLSPYAEHDVRGKVMPNWNPEGALREAP